LIRLHIVVSFLKIPLPQDREKFRGSGVRKKKKAQADSLHLEKMTWDGPRWDQQERSCPYFGGDNWKSTWYFAPFFQISFCIIAPDGAGVKVFHQMTENSPRKAADGVIVHCFPAGSVV